MLSLGLLLACEHLFIDIVFARGHLHLVLALCLVSHFVISKVEVGFAASHSVNDLLLLVVYLSDVLRVHTRALSHRETGLGCRLWERFLATRDMWPSQLTDQLFLLLFHLWVGSCSIVGEILATQWLSLETFLLAKLPVSFLKIFRNDYCLWIPLFAQFIRVLTMGELILIIAEWEMGWSDLLGLLIPGIFCHVFSLLATELQWLWLLVAKLWLVANKLRVRVNSFELGCDCASLCIKFMFLQSLLNSLWLGHAVHSWVPVWIQRTLTLYGCWSVCCKLIGDGHLIFL